MRGRGKPRPNGFSARARSWRPPQCVMFAGARAGLEDARGGGDGGGRGAGLPGALSRAAAQGVPSVSALRELEARSAAAAVAVVAEAAGDRAR